VSYAGKVLVVAAQKNITESVLDPGDPSNGWQVLVSQSLRSLTLEGGHLDLLREPLVARVADVLRQEIA
jgi:thioesterase domain-containing protein